jgi:hypothetical protein
MLWIRPMMAPTTVDSTTAVQLTLSIAVHRRLEPATTIVTVTGLPTLRHLDSSPVTEPVNDLFLEEQRSPTIR